MQSSRVSSRLKSPPPASVDHAIKTIDNSYIEIREDGEDASLFSPSQLDLIFDINRPRFDHGLDFSPCPDDDICRGVFHGRSLKIEPLGDKGGSDGGEERVYHHEEMLRCVYILSSSGSFVKVFLLLCRQGSLAGIECVHGETPPPG